MQYKRISKKSSTTTITIKFLTFLLFLLLVTPTKSQGGIIRSPPTFSQVSWHEINDLPTSIDWGNHTSNNEKTEKRNINFLTTIKNQHLPRYCGSCWAQATTSAMSDRINIHINKGINPEISISPQMLVSCSLSPTKFLHGCSGGDTWESHKWISENFLYPSSCFPYIATNGTCTDKSLLCYDLTEDGRIVKPDYSKLRKYTLTDIKNLTEYFDQVHTNKTEEEQLEIIKRNELNMMAELQNGPIVCGISVPSDLESWTGDGVYSNPVKAPYVHDISVVGYSDGEEGGEGYWIVRNSWGEFFGYRGLFKVLKGKGILGIELICRSGMPVVKEFSQEERAQMDRKVEEIRSRRTEVKNYGSLFDIIRDYGSFYKEKISNYFSFSENLKNSKYSNKNTPLRKNKYKGCLIPLTQRQISELKIKTEISNNLPEELDYSNYKSQNILTWTINQHRPQWCGSCYAQAPIGILGDRINKIRVDKGETGPYTKVTLSVQQVLNCGIGACPEGGSSFSVFAFLQKQKAVPWGCQVYRASSPPFYERTCSDIQNCATCEPDGSLVKSKCYPVEEYEKYGIKEYGVVMGAQAMKTEIMNNGPIQCSIMVTDNFYDNYKGGIYSEYIWNIQLNHAIAVVGWGVEDGVEFWRVRNSWGVMWGEEGYFRIKMYEDNLGIETQCGWAVPDFGDGGD